MDFHSFDCWPQNENFGWQCAALNQKDAVSKHGIILKLCISNCRVVGLAFEGQLEILEFRPFQCVYSASCNHCIALYVVLKTTMKNNNGSLAMK